MVVTPWEDDPANDPPTVEELAYLEQAQVDRLMEHAGAGVTRAEALLFLRAHRLERERAA